MGQEAIVRTGHETTDLFILTFVGNPGETVTLSLSDLENTYCTIAGSDLNPASAESITVTASNTENSGKKAVIGIDPNIPDGWRKNHKIFSKSFEIRA